MRRLDIYKLLDDERKYQSEKWNEDSENIGNLHTPEEWLTYMRDYVDEATHILSREPFETGRLKAMGIIRKITALGVAAMEDNPTPPR